MEEEAESYEIGPLKTLPNRRKVKSSEQIVLMHTTVDNMEAPGLQTVAATLSYLVSHSIYFSNIKSMVKGLPAKVYSTEDGNLWVYYQLFKNPWGVSGGGVEVQDHVKSFIFVV